ncbi:uncharacterized protein K452DRAFT_231187 [Aplosporella prunicola CBS 121167]|uniref:Transposase IS30-like HTH domain-containing protein n=1 Tax=Aplosporella prunicola CBS 121167 TaxID=1176127 RepID=A0A6A6B9H9_9PEZI|nr:uncharacterized protein K452DRAFT_231187 [Aplosporella prunicola CBS 121167]KAF2139894.1 hypothetical protein K452DRAFT_231187 [Aplosporella prunicola CBS 121167]
MPVPAPSTPPARRTKRPDLSRDQRLQVLTLRSASMSYEQISRHLGITMRQVQNACTAGHPTPTKRKGRPRTLTDDQIDELEQFVCSSRANSILSYQKLSTGPFAHWNASADAIKNALHSRGYKKRSTRAKQPPSNQTN